MRRSHAPEKLAVTDLPYRPRAREDETGRIVHAWGAAGMPRHQHHERASDEIGLASAALRRDRWPLDCRCEGARRWPRG
jgi:hypothetical protein